MNTEGFTHDEIDFLRWEVPHILEVTDGNYTYASILYNSKMNVWLSTAEFRARFDDFMAPAAEPKAEQKTGKINGKEMPTEEHLASILSPKKESENTIVEKFLSEYGYDDCLLRNLLEEYDAFRDKEEMKLAEEVIEKILPMVKSFDATKDSLKNISDFNYNWKWFTLGA